MKTKLSALAILMGLTLSSWQAIAQETIYLINNTNNIDNSTQLYQVHIDDATNTANLTLLTTLGPTDGLEWAESIATNHDGSRVYFIDLNKKFGYYDVASNTVNVLGDITDGMGSILPGQVTQAAISPLDGNLYFAVQHTNKLYMADVNTGIYTEIGTLTDIDTESPYTVSGGDFSFDAAGALTHVNRTAIYALTLPMMAGEEIAANQLITLPPSYNGAGHRANGGGDLLSSKTSSSFIDIRNKNDGTVKSQYNYMLNGSPFTMTFGDLATPTMTCNFSHGYWKNHDWGNNVAIINGEVIDEATGKMILSDAKSKNYSMLFAQLITAKLNVNNSGGIESIDESESALSSAGISSANYNAEFASKANKKAATSLSTSLDNFNNISCDD